MERSESLISVILPVRNGSVKLLERAVGSVLSQSYESFELLLIDDGSCKTFSRKLEKTASTDKRIRVFHIKPSGVSAARNFALGKARGDIITYIDGDDAISPHCFEEAVKLLTDKTIDAVWGGTCFLNNQEFESRLEASKGRPLTTEELKARTLKLSPGRIHRTRAECLAKPYRFTACGYINRGIAARFLRKKAFDEKDLRFPEGIRMYEDTIWNLRIMKYRLCYVKTVWYYYLNNSSSVSNGYNENVLKDTEVPLKRIRKMLDLGNKTEYAAYTRFLMDSLRYVYKCMYGNPAWKPDTDLRFSVLSHIYRDTPWKEIGSFRFFKAADSSDRVKSVLYRMGLLFAYWKLTWKKM